MQLLFPGCKRSVPLRCRQERWRCASLECRLPNRYQELQQRPTLLSTSRYYRQQPLGEPTPHFALPRPSALLRYRRHREGKENLTLQDRGWRQNRRQDVVAE
jgi:hypothetical protein